MRQPVSNHHKRAVKEDELITKQTMQSILTYRMRTKDRSSVFSSNAHRKRRIKSLHSLMDDKNWR